MNMDTYNAIMQYRDQMITAPHGNFYMEFAIFNNNQDTIKAITKIARNAGHKVTKRIIGKGDIDAECHFKIN